MAECPHCKSTNVVVMDLAVGVNGYNCVCQDCKNRFHSNLPDQLQTVREPSARLFEAWFGRSFPDDHSFAKRSDGRYFDPAVRCAWAGYQTGYKAALTTPGEENSSLRTAKSGDEL